VKTDDLIAMLAAGASPVESGAATRQFRRALAWGMPIAALLMTIFLGVRPDLAEAALLPMFWLKLLFPVSVAALAFTIAQRLSRPGVQLGRLPAALAAVFIALWLAGAVSLGMATPDQRGEMLFGESWSSCPFNIAFLSVPLFAAAMWAMKGLAPTRLSHAGAAAGLLAGAGAAAVYALHCPEMQPPFLGVWYVAGMLIPTAAGALAGPRLLRW
jgi:hypothetical protein